MNLEISQSTPTAAAIARVVQANYSLGEVVAGEFLRRSFNQVYRLTLADGRHVVARLCAERPRGEPHLAFEADAATPARAAARWPPACAPAPARSPIGCNCPRERALMLFEHLDGASTGDQPERIQAFGRGLAQLHAAGEGFASSASHYTLDLDYLLMRPLQHLLRAPTLTAELRPQFRGAC
ncbi:MAG: phosphotransferase [Comamonadaceae bacterium]|nr:phosphotransferase [Comamonadaceae bacterium]